MWYQLGNVNLLSILLMGFQNLILRPNIYDLCEINTRVRVFYILFI
jgi:hypothetical protein